MGNNHFIRAMANLLTNSTDRRFSGAGYGRHQGPYRAMAEFLEQRLALTINEAIPPGGTLTIDPISSVIPSGMTRMDVLYTTVPGVSHGTIYRVSGAASYVWGTGTNGTNFEPGSPNDRIYSGEGFQYVNNGTGDGTTESIPVMYSDGFTNINDTIVITISSHLTPPTITTQPGPFIQIPPGGTATMSVAASGTPTPTYQWYSGVSPSAQNPIAGATSTSYTTPALTTVQQYFYWVKVSNADGVADSQTVTVQVATPTSVATSNVSTTFQETAHPVNVSATVSPAENSGNVTYTVVALGLTARSATVSNGQAGNTALNIPAAAPAGVYTLNAEYDAPAGIASSTDNKTLTINAAGTTTVGGSQATTATSTGKTLTLSATVTSPAGPVNEGTVTFVLMNGSSAIGTATTSATVSNGAASVAYTLPANTSAGVYTISEVYNPGNDFTVSSDANHTVTVSPVVTPNSSVFIASAATLTITGMGFSNTNSANVVTFSPAQSGSVTASTPTSLTYTFTSAPAAGTLTATVTTNGVGSGAATEVAAVQLLPVWMAANSVASWNQVTQTLLINGAATMIADPQSSGDLPLVTVSRGTSLTIAPLVGHQAHVSALGISGSGLVTVPATTGQPTVLSINGGVFSIGPAGILNLNNNDLDVAGTSLTTVKSYVTLGRNLSSSGITSNTVTSDPTHLTTLGVLQNNQSGTAIYTAAHPFDGFTPSVADVLVKFTYTGDANLDGKIDGSDYSAIDASVLSEKTGPAVTAWSGGDFNYDNVVDGSDYTLIDNGYNRQTTRLGAAVDFSNGFANAGPSLVVNGTTMVSGTGLQLTANASGQGGSAYAAAPLPVAKFHTSFTFSVTAGAGTGDGFTFVIQNNNANAVGTGGGGLGYLGMSNSIAIKFDLYDNAGEGTDSTGLYIGGAVPQNVGSVDLSSTGIDLHGGRPIRADMAYNGTSLTVLLTDTVTGATATQSYTVNIAAAVAGPTAYFGFTAATGGATAQQVISNWTVFSS